jgi:hypothetical protein
MLRLRCCLQAAGLVAALAALGGCVAPELRSLMVQVNEQVRSVTLRATATHADCSITARSGAHLRHECDYTLGGRLKRASVFIQDTATVGLLVDPVILQLPEQATNVSGIYSDGPTNGTLRVMPVVGDLHADLTRKIIPEPGHKLYIIEFPTPAPPLDGRLYTFGLVFAVPNLSSVRIKALFAAKATVNATTYYAPLFPCATTFASIPALTLRESSDFVAVNLTPVLAANACNGSFYTFVPAAPEKVTVIEYYNESLDHYFVTWLDNEIAILDAGVTIRGWRRTGRSFKAWAAAQPDTSPVCRYYIPPDRGDSHFYGRGAIECDATGGNVPDLQLEAREFMFVKLPLDGLCPTDTVTIYRVFSNRPDANHRYMDDLALRDEMTAIGWLAEGDGPDRVVMCTPP